MPIDIANEMARRLYMPTTMHVPVLNYLDEKKREVEMALVGIPSAFAVQINDGLQKLPGTQHLTHGTTRPT